MNPKNGKFRVILVYLSFIPLALGAMWLVGGRPLPRKVTVQTNQKAARMLSKLVALSDTLPEVSGEVTDRSAEANNAVFFQADTVSQVSAIEMRNQSDVQNVRFDIITEEGQEERDSFFCVDPSIIGSEEGFNDNGLVSHKWIGKISAGNQTLLVMEETDQQGRSRIVQIKQSALEFEPAKSSTVGKKVLTDFSYSFEFQHQGLKRIYGRFLERTCEANHRRRLLWICDQLKDN